MRRMLCLLVAGTVVWVVAGRSLADEGLRRKWADHPVNCWVQQSPRPGLPSPRFPYEGSGGYDPFTRLWIHHGGHDGIPQGFHTFVFDLETGRWQQRFPPTSPPGACCVDGANVFDRANRLFVRFPGGSLGHGYQWSRGVKLKASHVWVYDPSANVWTNMRPPPYGRAGREKLPVGGLNSTGSYDPVHELVLSFGGKSRTGNTNLFTAYDAYSNTLYRLKSENAPPPRDGCGMAYDARNNKVVLFGSQYLVDPRTWIYDFRTGRWEAHHLTPCPPYEKYSEHYCTIPRLAYDSRHGVILGIFWYNETRGHETWAFDTARLKWTRLNPAREPSGSRSRSRNLDYDAERNIFILETSSAVTNRPEIWTYRYAPAEPSPGPEPPAAVRVVTEADGTATLRWQRSPGAAVKEYRVYRARPGAPWEADYQPVGRTSECCWQDRGLHRGVVYGYRVQAVDEQGRAGPLSPTARTQPRVPAAPIVSVLAADHVELRWPPHPAEDVVGYNVYRGRAVVRTVTKGTPRAWRDNDPAYDEPKVVEVMDIVSMEKLNDEPLATTVFADHPDLKQKDAHSGGHKLAVYAYLVRAVNRLGVESGPSPYALTIPSAPLNVLCREDGEVAHLKWDAAAEKNIVGYHVYRLQGTWEIVRVTERPVRRTELRIPVGRNRTRFWVTAVDGLGQEGEPSSPAWYRYSHKGFYQGPWHQ